MPKLTKKAICLRRTDGRTDRLLIIEKLRFEKLLTWLYNNLVIRIREVSLYENLQWNAESEFWRVKILYCKFLTRGNFYLEWRLLPRINWKPFRNLKKQHCYGEPFWFNEIFLYRQTHWHSSSNIRICFRKQPYNSSSKQKHTCTKGKQSRPNCACR